MFDALDVSTGHEISAHRAERQGRGAYRCPSCKFDTYLRGGNKHDLHFAHYSEIEARKCRLFHSVPGGRSSDTMLRLMINRHGVAVQTWSNDTGWLASSESSMTPGIFSAPLGFRDELVRLSSGEPLLWGATYALLLPVDAQPPEQFSPCVVQSSLEAWTVWAVVLPATPSLVVRDWLRSMGHLVELPTASIVCRELGARSDEESQGVLDAVVGKKIVVVHRGVCRDGGGIELRWNFYCEEKRHTVLFTSASQTVGGCHGIIFTPQHPGEWAIRTANGGGLTLWLRVSGSAIHGKTGMICLAEAAPPLL